MKAMFGSSYAIGHCAPRVDALTKVTGEEIYAADYFPVNHVWAGVKRAAFPHASIKAIEYSTALSLPDVVTILTGKDIKGPNRLGIFEKDQPVLATEVVRHYGDAVALVVAETQSALAEALERIYVVYEEIQGVFSPQAALAEGAPQLHPNRQDGNLLLQGEVIRGKGKAGLADCAYAVEVPVSLGWQEHAFLETQTGVAWLDENNVIVIVASTQTPFRDRLELAAALGLPPARIRIIAPYLGGGFGGKDGITVQGFLALAAMHAGGRPVKLHYSRQESILAGTKRHPVNMTYRLGCDKAGVLQALDCELLFDTGAYASLGSEVFTLAMEHAGGPYRIPHVSIEGKLVYTNNPVAGAFRGFGVPQVAAGIEQAVDELAKQAGIDPLVFRLLNAVERGDEIPSGVLLSQTVGMKQCLQKARDNQLWQTRNEWIAQTPALKKRGVGLAATLHGQGFGPVIPDYANAKIEVTPDGKLVVCAGVSDMGQGNATTYLQIVSHILCQNYDCMQLALPDTAKTLPSASSSASRTTFTYGNALIGAAELLKRRLLGRAALLFSFQILKNVQIEELHLVTGQIVHAPTGRKLPLAAIAATMDAAERVATFSYTCPASKQELGAELRPHGFGHRVFSFAVQLARLEVDTLTGEISICDFLSVIEAGKVINPQLFEQQIQGGVAQGLGYALYEDFVVTNGQIKTPDFATYILPTALDIPKLETQAVELSEDDGPFGMKGVGELCIDAVYPAVANAVAAALGRRIYEGPLSAEKALAALTEQRRTAGESSV